MINNKEHLKSLTLAIHQAVKAKPSMKLSELREIFSKAAGKKDWNTALASFDSPQATAMSTKTEKTAFNLKKHDVREYDVSEYDKKIHGTLSPILANELIELFFSSEFWHLAPFCNDASLFDHKEEALAFVREFPGMPLYLVISTSSSTGCVNVLANSNENGYLFRDESELNIFDQDTYENTAELKARLADFMTLRAKYDFDEDVYAIPYLGIDSAFKDYANSDSYFQDDHGYLYKHQALELVALISKADGYTLGKLDGTPFDNDEQALEFINTFDRHPLIIIASLGWSGYGVSMNIASFCNADCDKFRASDRNEFSDKGFVCKLDELKREIPVLAEDMAKSEYSSIDSSELSSALFKISEI